MLQKLQHFLCEIHPLCATKYAFPGIMWNGIEQISRKAAKDTRRRSRYFSVAPFAFLFAASDEIIREALAWKMDERALNPKI